MVPTLRSLIVCSALALGISSLVGLRPSEASTPFDARKCAVVGRATADNDVSLDSDRRPAGRSITLPKVIVKDFRAAAARLAKEAGPNEKNLTCDMIFDPVYRVSLDGSRQLFVGDLSVPAGRSDFFLFLYDSKTGSVSKKPVQIGSKWIESFGAQDDLIRLPIISASSGLTGQAQLIFQERVHNGTVYNGVVYHYFDFGSDLALIPVLAVETRLVDIRYDGAMLIREAHKIDANHLRLDVSEVWSDGHRRRVGYVLLGRKGFGRPFRVIARRSVRSEDASLLITECEERRDDAFLVHGCDFYY